MQNTSLIHLIRYWFWDTGPSDVGIIGHQARSKIVKLADMTMRSGVCEKYGRGKCVRRLTLLCPVAMNQFLQPTSNIWGACGFPRVIQVELMGAELTGLDHCLCLPMTLSQKSNCQ